MIFVQIASYRDNVQLIKTITNCINMAADPSNLVFGIIEQSSPTDPVIEYPKQCKHVIRIDAKDSLGVCSSREMINSFYNNEEYYLQIDSHTRFDQNWDTTLIDQINECDVPNPVFTMYPSMFWLDDQENDVYGDNGTLVTIASGFRDDGSLILEPRQMSYEKHRKCRFLAGGFIFASGEFAKNVKYDPNIYFIGEEIILTIQAFTRGYTLLNPVKCPVYHFYNRVASPHHWDDHPNWWQDNNRSLVYVNNLIVNHHEHSAYFGNVRSVSDYEAYSGISFKDRTLDDAVKNGIEPVA